jgi:hypothetical protein
MRLFPEPLQGDAMRKTLLAATAAALLCMSPAAANELSLSLGVQDLVGRGTAPSLGLEYRVPVGEIGPAPLNLGAAAEVDSRGDAWGGGGVVAALPVASGLRLEASVMPGVATRRANGDAGPAAAVRSRIGLKVNLPGAWSAGLTFTSRSNGGTRGGPGVGIAFGRAF